MTTDQQTYHGAGCVILYQPSTADALGLDPTLPGHERLDVDDSCAMYDAVWRERVQAAYPEAEIREDAQGLRVCVGQDTPADQRLAETVLADVAAIGEELFSRDGDAWIMEGEATL